MQFYLPSDTPPGLQGLREQELQGLRNDDGQERRPWDRVYNYAVSYWLIMSPLHLTSRQVHIIGTRPALLKQNVQLVGRSCKGSIISIIPMPMHGMQMYAYVGMCIGHVAPLRVSHLCSKRCVCWQFKYCPEHAAADRTQIICQTRPC